MRISEVTQIYVLPLNCAIQLMQSDDVGLNNRSGRERYL